MKKMMYLAINVEYVNGELTVDIMSASFDKKEVYKIAKRKKAFVFPMEVQMPTD